MKAAVSGETQGFAFETAWGADVDADGRAHFRLWAPAQQKLAVALGTAAPQPMTAEGDGWYHLETHARAGTPYAFVLGDGMRVPDPAARAQADDVHGPSLLVDPHAYQWRCPDWRGRPWEEAVVYELHTGTYFGDGTFDAVAEKLDHIVGFGATAVELMPVAQFAGSRGWGYDAVLPYAPHRAYGGPEGLKRLVDAAHERGLMVLLDVIYNHFGPDGNYLHLYAPDFFNDERHTPWGAAIAFERQPVRRFFIDNALYWLEEFRVDGLRLDAIDQIDDQSEEPILEEIAREVRARFDGRHIHLTTEDDRNIVHLHERNADGRPKLYTAEWNDDIHHAYHVVATGESDGYYLDYVHDRHQKLARGLAEGYIYQGEASDYLGHERGHASGHLPATAFINFLQNHDQIGNRAFGERLTDLADGPAVEALAAILLLSPQIPLLFMGEEWGETRPFCFFTDFHGELGDAVREGRRNEFRNWPAFRDPKNRELIPDPNAAATADASAPDWSKLDDPDHAARLAFVGRLLALRHEKLVPRLAGIEGDAGRYEMLGQHAFMVRWRLGRGRLTLMCNLDDRAWHSHAARGPDGFAPSIDPLLFEHPQGADGELRGGVLPGWSVVFHLFDEDARGAETE